MKMNKIDGKLVSSEKEKEEDENEREVDWFERVGVK